MSEDFDNKLNHVIPFYLIFYICILIFIGKMKWDRIKKKQEQTLKEIKLKFLFEELIKLRNTDYTYHDEKEDKLFQSSYRSYPNLSRKQSMKIVPTAPSRSKSKAGGEGLRPSKSLPCRRTDGIAPTAPSRSKSTVPSRSKPTAPSRSKSSEGPRPSANLPCGIDGIPLGGNLSTPPDEAARTKSCASGGTRSCGPSSGDPNEAMIDSDGDDEEEEKLETVEELIDQLKLPTSELRDDGAIGQIYMRDSPQILYSDNGEEHISLKKDRVSGNIYITRTPKSNEVASDKEDESEREKYIQEIEEVKEEIYQEKKQAAVYMRPDFSCLANLIDFKVPTRVFNRYTLHAPKSKNTTRLARKYKEELELEGIKEVNEENDAEAAAEAVLEGIMELNEDDAAAQVEELKEVENEVTPDQIVEPFGVNSDAIMRPNFEEAFMRYFGSAVKRPNFEEAIMQTAPENNNVNANNWYSRQDSLINFEMFEDNEDGNCRFDQLLKRGSSGSQIVVARRRFGKPEGEGNQN